MSLSLDSEHRFFRVRREQKAIDTQFRVFLEQLREMNLNAKRTAKSPTFYFKYTILSAWGKKARDLRVGAKLLVISCDQFPMRRDHVEAVVRTVRRSEPVATAHHDPQPQLSSQTHDRLQFVNQDIPVKMIPAFNLALRVTGYRPFRKMHKRRTCGSCLFHQPSDFPAVFTNILRDETLGRG